MTDDLAGLTSARAVWDFTTGKEFAPYFHDDAVLSVAWSPDSSFIASASRDQTVQIYLPSRTALDIPNDLLNVIEQPPFDKL